MLNDKRFNIVLSLLIAIGIWAYVIGETNPTDSKTYRMIPVQFVNEQVLDNSDLAISSISAETVNITLTGTRANINRIDPKEITAVVDLADAGIGENQLRINFRVPDNVEIEDKSLNKVTVHVERKVSKEFGIEPEYQGAFATDEEPITVEMNRNRVVVTGAESLIEKIDHICAKVGEGEVTEELKTIGCRLVPVDESGRQVERVTLSAKSVQVTAQLATVKTVPLEVPVVDRSGAEQQKEVTTPQTITIKGKAADVEVVELITAQTVDITDIVEDTQVEIIPILPTGVQVSTKSEDSLKAQVSVKMLDTKSFTFATDEIELKNLDEDFNAEIRGTEEIQVIITGREEQLAAVKKEDITLSLDLTGLKEGTHQIVLKAICNKAVTAIEVNPEELRVVIA